MKVYPKQIIFCPQTKQEQDGNKCTSCPFYKRHKTNAERLFLDCAFDKKTNF
jgi:hypothetical protein